VFLVPGRDGNSLAIQDSNLIQEYFSAEKQPTLWRALPALEELQTAWEKKRGSPKYVLYKDALTDGLEKLQKYYSRLDEKPSFILVLGELFAVIRVYTIQVDNSEDFFQSFTHTTSLHISNSRGVVQKSKLLKLRRETLAQRIGRMRLKKLLKIL